MIADRMNRWWILALAMTLLLAGCEGVDEEQEQQENDALNDPTSPEHAPPLESLDTLMEGAPGNEELPDEAKADEIFPSSFDDLLELQSPMSNQGRRGVCSVFSTVGLMEHLYIKSGLVEDPNFSEQYLQWSAKFEVESFQNSSGSNANFNLQAISNYGIVEEELWPYESSPWGASDDEECTGEDKPTRCFTNGHPPTEAEEGPKYSLPRGRWISTRTRDIKAHMYNNGKGVVVGGEFYYQAWNHGSSDLPTSQEYSREGYVLYPNEDDIQASQENPAGHSILLVGWDDELEVERLDGEGEVMLDENDEPKTEQGFFIFKNSWGTGGFGSNNPYGDGYGYISYDYVEQFKSGRVAGAPSEQHLPDLEEEELECAENELECDDQCVSSDESNCGSCGNECAVGEICAVDTCEQLEGEEQTFTYDGDDEVIPDNDPDGLVSEIDVDGSGIIQELTAEVWIEHSFNGDISIELIHPNGDSVELREADGSPGWDIIDKYDVDAFIGEESQGTWQLKMVDHAQFDEGSLLEWSLHIVR